MPVEYIDYARCDWRARCWVCGTYRDRENNITHHTGRWHERFDDNPLIQRSEVEGWGRELRSVVVMNLAKRMLIEQHGFKFPPIEALLPSMEWIENTSRQAAFYEAGKAWQVEHLKNSNKLQPGFAKLADVSRDAFRRFQLGSPNRYLHLDHNAIARRITGDRT